MNIDSIEQISIEAEGIQAYLEERAPDDPSSLIDRGNELSVYIARTGKLLADAKYHHDIELSSSIVRELGKQCGCPASVLKSLVESSCARTSMLVNTLERMNRTAVHQQEWIRTVISYTKEEMRSSTPVNQKRYETQAR
jgi:hypothetical protein